MEGGTHLNESVPLLRELLNIVPRSGVIRQIEHAGEAVDGIALRSCMRVVDVSDLLRGASTCCAHARTHCDVYCLPEDAVSALRVSDDLRVATADVEHDGVHSASHAAPHLDVCDAVIHAHYLSRNQPRDSQEPRVVAKIAHRQPRTGFLHNWDSMRTTTAPATSGPPMPGPLV